MNMFKSLFFFSLIASGFAYTQELKVKEGHQYFGKSLPEQQVCALSFLEIRENTSNILGYRQNQFAVEVEFTGASLIKTFDLRNKAYRRNNRFTPYQFTYIGSEKGNRSAFASWLTLNLNEETGLPSSFELRPYGHNSSEKYTCLLD